MANHSISLNEAIELTKKNRQDRQTVVKSEYQDQDIIPICETFDKEAILDLLNRTECRYFRIYYGMSDSVQLHAVLVGANEDGIDILPGDAINPSPLILDRSERCPRLCPPPSDLNTD